MITKKKKKKKKKKSHKKAHVYNYFTAKNTVISPNSLVWKSCGKAQCPHSIARNYAETVPFHKIFVPGN